MNPNPAELLGSTPGIDLLIEELSDGRVVEDDRD